MSTENTQDSKPPTIPPLPPAHGSATVSFARELEQLINKYSRENGSNTPDFILAEYLMCCLLGYDQATESRDRWYGHCGNTSRAMKPKCTAGSVNLADAVKAAWRLRYYGYHNWSRGQNECSHGIAKGIHCERCDELLLRKAYEQLSSPNSVGTAGG